MGKVGSQENLVHSSRLSGMLLVTAPDCLGLRPTVGGSVNTEYLLGRGIINPYPLRIFTNPEGVLH